jgi:hypothetical protein
VVVVGAAGVEAATAVVAAVAVVVRIASDLLQEGRPTMHRGNPRVPAMRLLAQVLHLCRPPSR